MMNNDVNILVKEIELANREARLNGDRLSAAAVREAMDLVHKMDPAHIERVISEAIRQGKVVEISDALILI